jgi:hypothetical protein
MQHTHKCLLLITIEPESIERAERAYTQIYYCIIFSRVAKETQVNIHNRQWRANGKSLVDVCSNYAVCCHAFAFAADVAFAEA